MDRMWLGIDWIAVGSIATAVMAVVTTIYVVLTRKILDEQRLPCVILSVYSEDGWVWLKIKNVGTRPARNFTATVKPFFDERLIHHQIGAESIAKMLNQTHIAPHQSICSALTSTEDIVKRPDFEQINREYNISLKYYSVSSRKPLGYPYLLDLTGVLIRRKSRAESLRYKVGKISKSLDAIAEQLGKR